MATYRVKPSKPMALFGAVVGVAILVFGLINVKNSGGFIWLWLAVGIGIIGFNLWAAFAKNGSVQTIHSSDDEPPTRLGTTVTRNP